MPPRLRSNLIAACTCRRPPAPAAPSYTYATATSSTPSSPPQPHAEPLDFLYPSFGFFSRSLPRPTPRKPAVAPAHWPILNPNATATWRKARVDLDTCACGRGRGSCLRCRGASTSARAVVREDEERHERERDEPGEKSCAGEEEEDEEGPVPPLRTAAPSPADVRTTSPPTRPPRRLLHKILPKSPHDRTKGLLDDLPMPYVVPRTKWRRRPWSLKEADVMLAKLRSIWTRRRKDIEAMSEGDRIDLIRAYGRIAKGPTAIADPAPGEAANADANAQLEELRRAAGAEMTALIQHFGFDDPEKSPAHLRSKAVIQIEALSLLGELPPVPVSSSIAPSSPFASLLHTIFTYSPDEPKTLLRLARQQRQQLQALAVLVHAWQRSPRGPGQALKFISGWKLGDLLINGAVDLEGRSDTLPQGLRKAVSDLVARLSPSPAEWFDSSHARALDRRVLGPCLTSLLALGENPLEALSVFGDLEFDEAARRDGVEISVVTDLVRGLTRGKLYADATELSKHLVALVDNITDLSDPRKRFIVHDAWRALGRLAANQGRVDRTIAVLTRLTSIGWDGGLESAAWMMRAQGEVFELEKVVRIFEEALPSAPSERDYLRLWGERVLAHVRLNDVEGALETLSRLGQTGRRPRISLLNTILGGYAMRTDVDKTYALFNRLSDFGLQPDAASYNALIALHARLHDPEAASSIVRRMLAAGISPDQTAWTTMMSAYVNVGQWASAIKIYHYLLTHPDPAMRPDTPCTNVILKASVLSGTAVGSTLAFFRSALSHGVRPNLQSYTLLLQSFCRNGELEAAEELVAEMTAPVATSSLPRPRGAIEPDAHVIGILVHTYLNAGRTDKARACLVDMRDRGIEESSVIYGLVVGSYLRQNPKEGLLTATKLAEDFLESTPLEHRRRTRPPRQDLPLIRGSEIVSVFFPLIHELCKQVRPREALGYFRLILRGQANVPMDLYATLMDGYRRVDEVENVVQIWNHLHRVVLQGFPAPADESKVAKVDSAHRDALCVPFSTYIDALSDRGAYTMIIEMWRTLSAQGFVFDSTNWNRLGVASCRWGHLEQAFWIAEHVLLRRPEEDLDRSALALELGPLDRVPRPLHAPKGVLPFRPEWRTAPKPTLDDLFAARPGDGEVDVGGKIIEAEKVGTEVHWFPHAAFVDALDQALREGVEAESEERRALVEEHPRTMAVLGRWQERKWMEKKERHGRRH